MVRWFEVACEDSRLLDSGDLRHLRQSMPKLDVTVDRQLEVVLSAIKASNAWAPDCAGDWFEDFLDRADPTGDEYDGLAWLVEHSEARRPPSLEPRGDKMLVYRVAAALFNNALLQAHARGQRLSEHPVTPSALERAINRLKQTSVE